MSSVNKNAGNASAIVDAVLADNAELRSQLAALIATVGQTNATVATLATAALTPKARATRVPSAPATVSEAERVCAEGGIRRGYRGKLVRDLVGRGEGVYVLSDVCATAFPGYPADKALPVCGSVSRRLSRLPRCGYTLTVDANEADPGASELVFAARNADGSRKSTDAVSAPAAE